jgi:diacylglycerol O-acyltransferase / wax synthase
MTQFTAVPGSAVGLPGPLDLMFHQAASAPSTPDASANVGAVLHLRGSAPDVATLRSHIASRIAGLPCLTHFLSSTGGDVRWDSASPDVDVHVVEQVLPEGREHLDTAVDRLRRTTLPAATPPWRLWLLHGHSRDHYALFYLTQHDVQDAANIVTVLEALFGAEISPEESSAAVHSLADAAPSTESDFLGTLDELVRCTRSHGIWHGARKPLSGRRVVHWVEIPTELLRETGRALGGSANDVHLAALGHALTGWAAEHWPTADGKPVPVMVPVNMRGPAELGYPGNRFFLGRVTVPGGPAAPQRRLAGTITDTASLKSASHRAALRRAIDMLPRPLLDLVTAASATPDQLSVVGSIFSMRHRLYLGSDVVERVEPLICCPDGFPASVALFLYQQTSSVCFHLDQALPAAETIPVRWRAAVNEIAEAIGVHTEAAARTT